MEMEDIVNVTAEETVATSADQLGFQQHAHLSGKEHDTGTEVASENSKRSTELEGNQNGKTQVERSISLVQEAQNLKAAVLSMLGGQKSSQEQSRTTGEQDNEEMQEAQDEPAPAPTVDFPLITLDTLAWCDLPEEGSEETAQHAQKQNEINPETQVDLDQQVNPPDELDPEEANGQNLEQGIVTVAPPAATGQDSLNVKENKREENSDQLAEEDAQTDMWQGWKKRWIWKRMRHASIIALQEMFAKEVDLQRTLKRVMPCSTAVVDYKENGDGDAVLLCHDSLGIVERGVSGKGYVAWVKVHTRVGTVGVLSLHAPNDSKTRREVRSWLRNLVADECWIILGDFNMVESQEDSIGP
ncbi:hypothetical protein R1sor_018150 [Riccia sorocarpa]|uniref:Uncharacterized protein n=1 Tax=Riccia sorocarpa TaxID=122646 RepID=A0ABD3I8Z2_9MARC